VIRVTSGRDWVRLPDGPFSNSFRVRERGWLPHFWERKKPHGVDPDGERHQGLIGWTPDGPFWIFSRVRERGWLPHFWERKKPHGVDPDGECHRRTAEFQIEGVGSTVRLARKPVDTVIQV
jgi:hypothetical protein